MPQEGSITNLQEVPVTFAPTDQGRPVTLDGPVRTTVLNGTSTYRRDDATNEDVLVSGDTPGDTTFLHEADADLGQGVQLIQDTTLIHVTGALADNLGSSLGTPRPKPQP